MSFFSAPDRRSTGRRLALLGLLACVLIAVWAPRIRRAHRAGPAPTPFTYSELLTAIDAHRVDSLLVQPGARITGTYTKDSVSAARPFAVTYTAYNADAVVQRAESAHVTVAFEAPPENGRWANLFGLLLNLGMIVALIWYLRRSMGQSGSEIVGDGKSTTTFADVAGNVGAIAELREVVGFLKDPQAFATTGARTPKGVLLFGPPGTGKTLMARAVAGEGGTRFYSLSAASITGFIVGLGAMRIRRVFEQARKTGGVIFIDELDSLGGKRGRNSSHNEDDRTLNQLLVELDGFKPTDNVVVIGATNRPDDLDPALMRPGRLDRHITVGLPSADERAEILALHVRLRQVPLDADVDLRRLARLMPGASGADLAGLVNEAAIVAARQRAATVAWVHIEAARDRLLLGKELAGFRASDHEWDIVAYHEAGHALVGVLACPEDGLHKVTIQPRGRAMGVAHFSPADDRHLHSRRYLEGQLAMAFGGRAAELTMFGPDRITSGAESDLQHANRIARQMVYRLGMGQRTGFLVHEGQPGSLSAAAHARMDEDVQQLLAAAFDRAMQCLATNRDALEALAQALRERETIDGAEAVSLMEAAGLVRPTGSALPVPPAPPALAS